MIRILNIAVILLMLLASVSKTQSLDSLINEAKLNNPRLKSLGFKSRAAEFRAESFNSYPAPILGLEFSGVPFWKFNIINNAMSNQLSLSQMFMLGGKVEAMAEAEKKNATVTNDNCKIYMINLKGQIKMSYYTLWLIERKIEVERKNIGLLNDLMGSLNTDYSAGRTNQADIFTLKAEIASGETRLLTLEKELEAETCKLSRLLGRDLSSAKIYIRALPTDTLKVSLAELEERLLNLNPSIKQMSSMIEMNEAMIVSNKKNLVPDLMLQAMIMRQPQGMYLTTKTDISMLQMQEPKTEYMYSVMASITLPFAPWAEKKYRAREEELLAGIRGIEYEKIDMQRDMLSQLKASVIKYRTSRDMLRLYSDNLTLYEQAKQAQLIAYQGSRTSISIVIDSYRMLLMQQMNCYMADADARMSLAEIEMMVGSSIDNL